MAMEAVSVLVRAIDFRLILAAFSLVCFYFELTQ